MRNVYPTAVKYRSYEPFYTGVLLIVPLPEEHESNMFVARRKGSSQGSPFIFSTLLKKYKEDNGVLCSTEIESGHCIFFIMLPRDHKIIISLSWDNRL